MDITKGKKKTRKPRAPKEPPSTPAHEAARGAVSAQEPDAGKSTGQPFHAAVAPQERVSAPLTAGHAALSPGDAGAGAGRAREIAYNHPSMRQSSTTVTPFASMRSNGPQFVGQAAFGALEDPAVVNIDMMPAAERAGLPDFRATPTGNPAVAGGYRTARNSATPDNGSHSLDNATSRRPMSAKAIDIMKAAMRAQRD